MASVEAEVCITLLASGDLSGDQFKLMEVTATGEVGRADATSVVAGVLMNKPTAQGQAATVCISGVMKVIAGADWTGAGVLLMSDANGLAILSPDLAQGFGIALDDIDTANQLGRVLMKQLNS